MEQNNDNNNNPLNYIFITDNQGKITSEIESLKNINKFFEYLKDSNIENDNKSLIIDQFTKKIKDNRYIAEYFSSYENKSIYSKCLNNSQSYYSANKFHGNGRI